MTSPFSLRLYVHDVGRADAFDKCTIPKTNGACQFQIKCTVLVVASLQP